jgi:sugar O-acyltransferase (sialic acid O-acetyltransferase NeuD family)
LIFSQKVTERIEVSVPAPNRPLILIGSGGHGRVSLEVAQSMGRKVAGFIDKTKTARTIVNGSPVLGGDELLTDPHFLLSNDLFVAIGEQEVRRRYANMIMQNGGSLASLAHPSCIFSPSATIGSGTILMPGTIVNANTRIGKFCIVNTGSTIDHDCTLEDGVQICPGVNLAGTVSCGADAFIGSGAVVVPRVRIGTRAIVGAGAVVVRDVPDETRVLGYAAR